MPMIELILRVYMRELVRVNHWMRKFDTVFYADSYGSRAMADLFREAALCRPTPEGPYERLYWLAWTRRANEVFRYAQVPFQPFAEMIPRPCEADLYELCEAYHNVALLSTVAKVNLHDILHIVDEIMKYRFKSEDLYMLMDGLNGGYEVAQIVRSCIATYLNGSDEKVAQHVVAAQLLRDETDKSIKWLDLVSHEGDW